MTLTQDEIDAKLRTLSLIPFLQKMKPMQLIPLATNMKVKIAKLGERIIRQGEKFEEFSIICEGKCTVIKEMY